MKPTNKIVVASCLALASCETSDMDHQPGDGSGADDGGSQQWGALSIDPGGFVVDGTRWWTATNAPAMRGLFAATGPVTIEVITDAGSVTAAIDGTMWSAKLPAGSIGASGNQVIVAMTNAGGDRISVAQTLVLDARAPAIALLPSLLDDERADTIDFSTGEPVHTHHWPEIALSALECTTVYKYAYLTGASDPPYGTQKTRNPIRYNFWIDEARLDATFTAFRVRTPENEVLRDWTAVATNGWKYTLWLLKDGSHGVPELEKRAGKYLVDVRARDWAGVESTATWCFDLQLLAAPLEVTSFSPADVMTWTLANDAPVSRLIEQGAPLVTQRVVQYTAEPMKLVYDATAGAAKLTRAAVDNIVSETFTAPIDCPLDTTDPRCAIAAAPVDGVDDKLTATIDKPALEAWLYDEATDELLARGDAASLAWKIPARRTDEPPRAYRIEIRLRVPELRPPGIPAPETTGEHVLLGTTYTGGAPIDLGWRCLDLRDTATGRRCHHYVHAWRMRALAGAKLELGAVLATVQTETEAQPLREVSYLTTDARSTGPLAWDGGQDRLPGVD